MPQIWSTYHIIRFTEAGELGPNKLFIFFVRGYLERSKYGPLTYAVGTQVTVRGPTGFEGLGHGVDVDGGVVGRGQVEGAICPKGGASQSMMAAWRRQLLRRIVLCEWREGQVAQSRPIPVFRGKYVRGPYFYLYHKSRGIALPGA